ncbi:MAG: TetR/AcrR family transcriptional regulator [Streptosporangiaceae bacterium]|nr:TetR/AcrR family transcriptional regulator [Streptosporangiaceae bacterium]
MGHREDLLAGAVMCLREKGYARTTARDIVAASGTNLASIGYHYGSTEALLNAAVLRAMEDFGAEIARAMGSGDDGKAGDPLTRFERFWTYVIESFRVNTEVWMATFDVFSVAQRSPEVRTAIANGLEDGRLLWARFLYGAEDDPATLRAVGSLYQALLSGVLVQWLVDPDRAPTAADLATALRSIATHVPGV